MEYKIVITKTYDGGATVTVEFTSNELGPPELIGILAKLIAEKL